MVFVVFLKAFCEGGNDMRYNRYLTSSEIRSQARRTLSGRWKEVILLHLVPILISIIVTGGIIGFSLIAFSRMAYNFEESDNNIIINFALSFITVGISYALLDLVRNKNYRINPLQDAFQVFSRRYFIPVLLIQLLQGLFVTLWTFLFIIPGIVKSYAYSQALFIYKDRSEDYENGYPSSLECITESKIMMHGHKGRLFLLHLSFLGWNLLEVVTIGIASIYVRPYFSTVEAIFYDNLKEVSQGELVDHHYNEELRYQETFYEDSDEDDFDDF